MSATKPAPPATDHTQELLDEALEESFPASDPPALVEPGGGISGTESAKRKRAPDSSQKPGEQVAGNTRHS